MQRREFGMDTSASTATRGKDDDVDVDMEASATVSHAVGLDATASLVTLDH